MPKTHETWTVLPHGPVETVDDGILTVTGEIHMPLGSFPRRMTIVRLAGGGTVVFSAIALREPEMRRIEALGDPAFLVVPDALHRLDARSYRERYPAIRVLAPPGARKRVEEAVPVEATSDALGDPDVRFEVVAGTGEAESALVVRRPRGTTLVTNDIIGHVRHPRGLGAQVMARAFGFGVRRPAVPRPVRRMVTDPGALAAQLRRWAEIPDLLRIVPSHGEVIASDPAGELRRIADGLG